MRMIMFAAIGLAAACERDVPPPDHPVIAATPNDVRLDGDVVLALDHGRVASGDRGRFEPPGGQAPRDVASKLVAALDHRCTPAKPVEFHLDGALSGETLFLLLASAGAAGCTDETFTVAGQPWRIPHHTFRGNTPDASVELLPATTDAEIARLATRFANPPPDGVLVMFHTATSARQVMLFAQATPPSMRRVYSCCRD
jgi:hypothetical protein